MLRSSVPRRLFALFYDSTIRLSDNVVKGNFASGISGRALQFDYASTKVGEVGFGNQLLLVFDPSGEGHG